MNGQPKHAGEFVTVEAYRLRTLLRIATEFRDPVWLTAPWVRELADQCGLDLSAAEKSNCIKEYPQ